MYECAHSGPTLLIGQTWSVQNLLLEPPQGGFLLFEAICLGIKNTPSLGDREAEPPVGECE